MTVNGEVHLGKKPGRRKAEGEIRGKAGHVGMSQQSIREMVPQAFKILVGVPLPLRSAFPSGTV